MELISMDNAYYRNGDIVHLKNNTIQFMHLQPKEIESKFNSDDIKKCREIIYSLLNSHYYYVSTLFYSFIRNYPDACFYLYKYIEQYHKDVKLAKACNSDFDAETLAEYYHLKVDQLRVFIIKAYPNINKVNSIIIENDELINEIIKFYDIVTEFLIRFYNFSLIGSNKQKVIITSAANCDKRFSAKLEEGYTLYRLQKVGFRGDYNFGWLYCLPVLPTKDIGFPFTEYIETTFDDSNGFFELYSANNLDSKLGPDSKHGNKRMLKCTHYL